MGQSQRTSRSPVITCCFQTGTEKTEVECGWQEGHQRSHEKTLGVETSRSSVATANRRKGGDGEDRRQETEKGAESCGSSTKRHP
jgi:hypothetical protein